MSVLTLTRDKWRKFKDENNLSKSSFFKKADVGPQLEKFQKALDACKNTPGKKSLGKCFTEADKLETAIEKFIKLKEAKAELDEKANKQLKSWSKELGSITKSLAKLYKESGEELANEDAKNMKNQLASLGL
ncbi:hypothetical protein VN12_15340 [Pirellula sp. SH-Sr6A]|uniref:hypothetical protein n=1 Tax=Pirellula sp. SH-Sr6A TaxID=1632865 RepID=UPI00078D2E86|nr:hypothetical protein [Pirellula sp. SH-Sr6A]AMV33500.1 hypothetical protein VN12_15340 [Pirellula sp. SH-Sr6A]